MEKKDLLLEIVSPTTHQTKKVEWIEVESPTGNFMVAPGHSSLVSIIKKRGRVVYKKKDEGEDFIDASGGIFKISHGKATILLDT